MKLDFLQNRSRFLGSNNFRVFGVDFWVTRTLGFLARVGGVDQLSDNYQMVWVCGDSDKSLSPRFQIYMMDFVVRALYSNLYD